MRCVDVAVIGAGPAGLGAALTAARLGRSTLIVERREFIRGACVNLATMPTSALREALAAVRVTESPHRSERLAGSRTALTFGELLLPGHAAMRRELEADEEELRGEGVGVIHGTAVFRGPHHLTVSTNAGPVEIEAERFVIATGTRPYRPRRLPFDQARVIDVDTVFGAALTAKPLPRTLVIIGADVIGSEYACLFNALGVEVHIVDRRQELIRIIDADLCDLLADGMRDRGIRSHLGEEITRVDRDGEPRVTVTLGSGLELRADMLMFAAGRSGATEEMSLEVAGVELTGRGLIQVNGQLETSAPHIYAAGNVMQSSVLESEARLQGRLAALNAMGEVRERRAAHYPSAIWTIPEIAMVGKTARELRAARVPHQVGVADFRDVMWRRPGNELRGRLILGFDPGSRQILGIQIIGEGACELIHLGQVAVTCGLTIDHFTDSVFNRPTISEVYKLAALDGSRRLGSESGSGIRQWESGK